MFYFRYKIVNTLHKDDNKYNINNNKNNNNLKYIVCFVEDIQYPEGSVYMLQYIILVKICCLSGRLAWKAFLILKRSFITETVVT